MLIQITPEQIEQFPQLNMRISKPTKRWSSPALFEWSNYSSCFGNVQILGTGMSAKMWEVTVDHARTCVLDKRVFLYCPPSSQQKNGVVFNSVGQVRGLLSECQYVPLDKLSETEKALLLLPQICFLFLVFLLSLCHVWLLMINFFH